MVDGTETAEKKETLKEKIFCDQCDNLLKTHEKIIYFKRKFFGGKRIMDVYNIVVEKCKQKADSPLVPNSIHIDYREANKNNNCQYYSKGKPEEVFKEKYEEETPKIIQWIDNLLDW